MPYKSTAVRRANKRNLRAKLRKEAMAALGNKCRHCGFEDWRALQIDHINGGGSKEHAKADPETYCKKVIADAGANYQLLCANCNWIKRVERGETRRRLPDTD